MDEFKEFDELIVKTTQEAWDSIQNNTRGKHISNQQAFYIIGRVLASLGCLLSRQSYNCRLDQKKTEHEMKELVSNYVMNLTLKIHALIEEKVTH